MEFLRSVKQFWWGILSRFYFWAPAVLLDPWDTYNSYIRVSLFGPKAGEVNMPAEYFPYVLGLGLAWAGTLTYHEIRQKGVGDPLLARVTATKQCLRKFVSEADDFIKKIESDQQEMSKQRGQLTPDERRDMQDGYNLPDVDGWHDRVFEYLETELSLAHASNFSGRDEYRQRDNNQSDYEMANNYIQFLIRKRKELMQLSDQIWMEDLNNG